MYGKIGMSSKNNHILIIGSTTRSLVNFRGSLIKNLVKENFKVSTFAGYSEKSDLEFFERNKVNHSNFNLINNRINFFNDLFFIFRLRKRIRQTKPDIVLAYTIKPILYSSIALIGTKIKFMPLITGLGFVFFGKSLFKKSLRNVVKLMFKIFLNRSSIIIFQNKDNLDYFSKNNIANEIEKIIIPGSGVNINHYSFTNVPEFPIKFIMISRLLYEKGVIEYLRAAEIVKNRFPKTEFSLVGEYDTSYDAISPDEISEFFERKTVNYLGYCKDVYDILTSHHVFVLPSYHEGMPKSVLEAMSVGRPIITTKAPGCRDTVKNGINGFVTDIKDINAISDMMIWFIQNPNKLNEMGIASRNLIEEKFDERIIVKKFLNIIKNL